MVDEESRTLWCGNLSPEVTEELLYELFLQAGPVTKVRIPKDKSGKQRSFGFITFKHDVTVPYAMKLMKGEALFGRHLRLQARSLAGNSDVPVSSTSNECINIDHPNSKSPLEFHFQSKQHNESSNGVSSRNNENYYQNHQAERNIRSSDSHHRHYAENGKPYYHRNSAANSGSDSDGIFTLDSPIQSSPSSSHWNFQRSCSMPNGMQPFFIAGGSGVASRHSDSFGNVTMLGGHKMHGGAALPQMFYQNSTPRNGSARQNWPRYDDNSRNWR